MPAKRVFLAATGQNRGKTTTSLGLLAAIRERGLRLGFLKPVGQRYLVVDGTRADEDAVLMSEVFGLPDALDDMSPVTLPRHFTTDYVMGRVDDDLGAQVADAYERVAADKDVVVIEGTGHAGVGAVVGLSNARVAAMLDAPVIIVSEGGIGRPIDEIVLNGALFAAHGVRVIGAVVNKVDVESHPDLPEVLERGLGQHGIELLGLHPVLAVPGQPVARAGRHSPRRRAAHRRGDAGPDDRLGRDRRDAGDPRGRAPARPDAPDHARRPRGPRARRDRGEPRAAAVPRVIGIVLTGGFRPPEPVLDALRDAGIFAYLVRTDTYRTAQAVDEILVKTHRRDTEKISTIIELVDGALDVDALLARL